VASTNLLVDNVAEDPVEIIGEATLYPSGTFAGGHIRVELAATESGDYAMIAEIVGYARENINVPGGGWIRASVINAQSTTNLSLVMNTA
jgi:hypothetical protein